MRIVSCIDDLSLDKSLFSSKGSYMKGNYMCICTVHVFIQMSTHNYSLIAQLLYFEAVLKSELLAVFEPCTLVHVHCVSIHVIHIVIMASNILPGCYY